MKFKVFGLNVSVLIFLLALALMPLISFADSPPPPPSLMTVHLTSNGVNETSIGQIIYHCAPETASGGSEQLIPLNCSAATCTNEPGSGYSRCAYFPEGYFSYSYHGQNKSSETFNVSRFYKYLEYRLDVQTGKMLLISNNNGPGGQPSDICPAIFILLAFIGFASKRG